MREERPNGWYGPRNFAVLDYTGQSGLRGTPPVNVSPPPLRVTPHDSGPVWVDSPSPYDSLIRTTSPVYPGTQGELQWPV